jgi:hypothetical protein
METGIKYKNNTYVRYEYKGDVTFFILNKGKLYDGFDDFQDFQVYDDKKILDILEKKFQRINKIKTLLDE